MKKKEDKRIIHKVRKKQTTGQDPKPLQSNIYIYILSCTRFHRKRGHNPLGV